MFYIQATMAFLTILLLDNCYLDFLYTTQLLQVSLERLCVDLNSSSSRPYIPWVIPCVVMSFISSDWPYTRVAIYTSFVTFPSLYILGGVFVLSLYTTEFPEHFIKLVYLWAYNRRSNSIILIRV